MTIWLTIVIAALAGVGFVWSMGRSSRRIDTGEVSESWLREQRAEKNGRSSV
jgi:hypothetical protein